MTPAERKHFGTLFQPHERRLLQEVGTKATGPRSEFAKKLALLKTAAEDKAYGVENLTAEKRPKIHIHPSNAETETTTSSLAVTEHVTILLEREIYSITSNEQKSFKKESSIHMIKFEAWWEKIGIQALGITIEQPVIHFVYPQMHLVSHISDSIR